MKYPPPSPEVERLFLAALELPAGERDACIGDAACAGEVRALLRAHESCEDGGAKTRAGVYRLERLIGRGGMGEVWLGVRDDGQFEQRAAIKLVRPGLGSPALLPRFFQERQVLARLHHPNIAGLLDGGISSDGRSYLVMEYVEGEPLPDFCEHGAFPLRKRIELFRQLCSAVEYAHRNLIVHCDIKPANVLVTSDGCLKLLDFGVARLIESGDAAGAATIPLVTPRYASPEQLRGDPVSTSSDIYSLGVLLFELLTGSLPYETKGETVPEVITAITTQEPRRASDTAGTRLVPPGDLDAILAKALQKDPAQRYGSVESFSADLSNYLEGLPVTARPLTRAYRLQKYVRRHWIAVTAVSSVGLVLAIATVVSVRAAHAANLERQRSARVQHFLEDVLSSANPTSRISGMETGKDAKLVDVIAAASARLSTVFADEPGVQSEMHAAIGRVYIGLADYKPAIAEVKAAMDHIGALDNRPAEKSRVLHVAARLDFDRGHVDLAEKEEREALELFLRSSDAKTDAQTHAILLNNFGYILHTQGKSAEGEQTLMQAVRLLESLPNPLLYETAVLHGNIGVFALESGHLEKGREEETKAIRKFSSLPSPPVYLGEDERILANIERLEGYPDRALTGFEKAVSDTIRVAGPDHPFSVDSRIQLAYQRAVMGHVAESEVELTRCLEIARKPDRLGQLPLALDALGLVRTLSGHPREGEPLLREAYARSLKSTVRAAWLVAQIELDLAECLQRQGRIEEAAALCRSGRDRYQKLLGPDQWATRDANQRLERLEAGRRRALR